MPSTPMSHEDCPSGFLLIAIKGFELVANAYPFQQPNWREKMPFGLGETILSHQVPEQVFGENYEKLDSYADFLQDRSSHHSFSKLYEYAFQTHSTALGDLLSKDAIVTCLFLVLILRQIKNIICPLFSSVGRNLARSTHGIEWERNNEEKIIKFGEYMFRLLYHFGVSVFGLYCFIGRSWWSKDGQQDLWIGYPSHPIESDMTWYYLVQSAYNVDAMVSLIQLSFVVNFQNPFSSKKSGIQSPVSMNWSPTCRGDFAEMAVHHVITNLLIFGSSTFRLTRMGSMVFMVHDISDVPVDMSKLANFMKWKITTIICFVTMVIVWAITRMGILPFVIYKSVLTQSHLTVPAIDVRAYYMIRPTFYVLFAAIIALHFFWFQIFIKIGYNLVFKKEIHDLSEHKNGEKQVESKKVQ
jgi:hypothetical protein